MGPANLHWYADRGLVNENGSMTAHYSAGRLDIYGLDESEYYGGMSEYDLPPMTSESWERFSDWLDDFSSTELLNLNQLVEQFKQATGHSIQWYQDSSTDS